MQGSSASGIKYSTKQPLNARLGIKPKDYDIAVVSHKLLTRARELGIDVLRGPLDDDQIVALGLTEARDILSKASKGGIPVNFKIYQSIDDVYNSDKTIPFDMYK